LINRLENHVLPDEDGNTVDLTTTQVNAALGLLRKAVPDLKAMELTGDDGGPLQINLVSFLDVTAEQLET
jgi:hypothetical protein